MLGYAREEMLGRPIFDFVAEEQREAARQAVAEKIRGERRCGRSSGRYVTRDGRRLIVAIEERYKRDDQGRIVGIRSTIQDITDRKRTEAALVASERRARALFEGIEDAVFVHDLDGRILDANPAACRRLGYTREEFLELTTADLDDPEFAAGFADRLQQQLERPATSPSRGGTGPRTAGSIPVDINTSTIQFEDQVAVLAVFRDITERKALEEARRAVRRGRVPQRPRDRGQEPRPHRSRRPATGSSPRGASTPWSSPTARAGSPCSTPPPSGSSATRPTRSSAGRSPA